MYVYVCIYCTDQMYQQQWCTVHDNCLQKAISCGVTCITGDQDHAVSPSHWAELATKSLTSTRKSFENINYPGNHFFIFDTVTVDTRIAQDIYNVMTY